MHGNLERGTAAAQRMWVRSAIYRSGRRLAERKRSIREEGVCEPPAETRRRTGFRLPNRPRSAGLGVEVVFALSVSRPNRTPARRNGCLDRQCGAERYQRQRGDRECGGYASEGAEHVDFPRAVIPFELVSHCMAPSSAEQLVVR